jgi:hypothetical protein
VSEQSKGILNNLIASVIWDSIKQLFGPAVLAGIVAVWQKLHGSMDWVAIVGIFVLASLLAFLNFRKPRKSPQPTVEALPARVEEPKLIIHNAVYAAGLETEVSVTEQLKNLTRDAIAITIDPTLGGLLPTDPAPGICKRLDASYSYGSSTTRHVSRYEAPPGQLQRLLLPEDLEVKRLEAERDQLKRKLADSEAKVGELADKYLAAANLIDTLRKSRQ